MCVASGRRPRRIGRARARRDIGHMNVKGLYQELVVELGGQLNIFAEVMEIDVSAPSDKA